MRDTYGRTILIAILAAVIVSGMSRRAAPASGSAGMDSGNVAAGGSAGIPLRQYLISVLESGMNLEDIPPTHAMYPLRRVPLIATTAFLLLEYDTAAIERFYPILQNHLLRSFEEERLAAGGLVTGSFPLNASDGVYLSPALNAIANLEIHSLGLIAQRIGRYEDALELIEWSHRFARQVSHGFYDPSREMFLPVDRNGRFLARNAPGQILPLLLDRDMDNKLRKRIIEKCMLGEASGAGTHGNPSARDEAMRDPLVGVVIRALLSNLPYIEGGMLDLLDEKPPTLTAGDVTLPAHDYWVRFWIQNTTRIGVLFSKTVDIAGLRTVALLFQRESLMEGEDLKRFVSDVDSLETALNAASCDLGSHTAHIAAANRLLAAVSNIDGYLESGTQIWKVFDESRWRQLSPRTRKLVVRSLDLVVEELLQAKVSLSETFMKSTGIVADVDLPAGPVPLGTAIQIEATIRSAIDSLELSNIYLQFGENRWRITAPGQRIPIAPWTAPISFRRPLPVAPTTGTGLMTIPLFFDFLHEGSRVEIHRRAHIVFISAHRAAVRFPGGRTLGDDPLPVELILRFSPENDIRGVANGTFLKGIHCTPALPARFLVEAGADVTTLPLEVSCEKTTSPGIYPFSLSLELNGEPIAVFDERLVRPLRWLYLGPLPDVQATWENARFYGDNLFTAHATTDGRSVRWREVPAKANDDGGNVVASRLAGAGWHSCFLLYTIVESPAALKTVWCLECDGNASLWINGDLIFSTQDARDADRSGPIILREGGNSILIATSVEREPARIAFNLSDLSGLPVAGLGNDIASLIDGYHHLASNQAVPVPGNEGGMQFAEVTLRLDYPNAKDICIIGSFNNWEAGANPMRKSADGRWTTRVTLTPGRYPYKFLIDRISKITDPGSTTIEPDGFGGFNSILVVKKNGR